MRLLLLALPVLLLLACASARPVLYPNRAAERDGTEVVELEVETCLARAEDAELGSGAEKAGEIALDTAERTAAGAAAGAAGGAVLGRPGRGAAVGAASSAAYAFVRRGFRWLFQRDEPNPLERRYVSRCLREHGYEVIGWR